MARSILAAMSGGVDSAVAALQLKEKYDIVIGGTLELCDGDGIKDAGAVAEKIGIEHYYFNMRSQFKKYVMDFFASSYAECKTPNPCIMCNRKIKFGLLLDKAAELGCEKIATGHYAEVERDYVSGRYLLKKASDRAKDQTYVLYGLDQHMLSHCDFPLAGLTKDEIRSLAERAGIQVAHKKDSQDICFIPDGDYKKFLRENYRFSEEPGNFELMDGTLLGRHKGLFSYTTGQRKGLGVSYSEPLYVLEKDSARNAVILGKNSDLFKKRIYIEDSNWIPFEKPDRAIRAEGKIRYSQNSSACTVYPEEDGGFIIEFDKPQRAPTPGLSAVLYDGEYVLGGGIISRRF